MAEKGLSLFENDKFYYNEGSTNVKNIIKTLVTETCANATDAYKWTLVYPVKSEDITNFALIKATTTFGKEFHVRFFREKDCITHMEMAIGNETVKVNKEIIDKSTGELKKVEVTDLNEETCNTACRLSWYKKPMKGVKDWLPIQYWLNVTKDVVNIVLRGDPSPDVYPYTNYLTGYAYLGSLSKIEEDSDDDKEYNFGITTSSNIEPVFEKKFGDRTATGITDVCMIANKIGMPMQPHVPAFYTTHEFMDKCNVDGGSRWNNKKYQFSDITLVHPVEMERGKMQNILVGDGYGVFDADRLVLKRNTEKEENYKKFKITAPYNFLNNSANNNYCIAIRCYKDSGDFYCPMPPEKQEP
ncbi:hypothetical protein [Clostridium botulinum]